MIKLGFFFLTLAAQLWLWVTLIQSVPVLKGRNARASYLFDPDRHRISRIAFDLDDWNSPAVALDLTSGALIELPSESYWEQEEIGRNRAQGIIFTRLNTSEIRVEWIDTRSGATLERRILSYYDGVVNDRYLLNIHSDQVDIWDAENPDQPVHSVPNPAQPEFGFRKISGSDRVYCVPAPKYTTVSIGQSIDGSPILQTVVPGTSSEPTGGVQALTLMSVSSESIDLVASWEIYSQDLSGSFLRPATRVGDTLVTISPTADALDYHALDNGELVERRPLPEDFDPRTDGWGFHQGQLCVGAEFPRRIFDLVGNRWWSRSKSASGWFQKFPEHSLVLYRDLGPADQWSLLDVDARQSLLDVPASLGTPVIVGDQMVAICSDRHGFSVQLLSLDTKKTVRVYQPLWWVAPGLLLAIAAYIAWSVFWIRYSLARNLPAWIDVAAIGGIPVAVVAWELHKLNGPSFDFCFGGDILEPSIFAISCSGSFLAIGHAFFGTSRLTGRVGICLLFLAMIGWLSRFLLLEPTGSLIPLGSDEFIQVIPTSDEAWEAIYCMLPVWLTAGLTGALLVKLGFQVRSLPLIPIQPVTANIAQQIPSHKLLQRSSGRQWRITDLLLLMMVSAALVQAYLPLLDEEGLELLLLIVAGGFFLAFLSPVSLAAISCPILAFSALSTSRTAFWAAAGIALLLATLLVLQPIAEFVFGDVPLEGFLKAEYVRFTLSCPLAAFLMMIPFRLRGWRIARVPTKSNGSSD